MIKKTDSIEFDTAKSLQEIVSVLRSIPKANIEKLQDAQDDPFGNIGGQDEPKPDIGILIWGKASFKDAFQNFGAGKSEWGVQIIVYDLGNRRHVEMIALGESSFKSALGAYGRTGGGLLNIDYYSQSLQYLNIRHSKSHRDEIAAMLASHVEEKNYMQAQMANSFSDASMNNQLPYNESIKTPIKPMTTIPSEPIMESPAPKVLTPEEQEALFEKERKESFEAVKSKMANANSELSYKNVAEEFKEFSGYENADELANKCLEEAEICRKNEIYDKATSIVKKRLTFSSATKAIELFSSISGWKDADDQVEKYTQELEPLKAEEEKKRKKFTKIGIGVGIVALIAIIIIVAINLYNEKQEALKQFDSVVTELKAEKKALDGAVNAGQAVLNEQKGSEELLSSLQKKLDFAKECPPVNIPDKASSTSELEKQISELKDLLLKYSNAKNYINEAVENLAKYNQEQEKIANTLSGTFKSTVTSSDGYVFEVTWQLGKWIKASDIALIDSAWKTLGGKGETPYIDKISTSSGYTADKAMVLIGTCSFKNVTEGYNISADTDVSISANISVAYPSASNGKEQRSSSSMLIEYSDKQKTSNSSINPQLKSNTWGPVTFALAVPNVFVPNNKVDASSYYVKFDKDATATIGVSW